jgi:hypothetical protein
MPDLPTFTEWLATAPLSKLVIEHSRLNRCLGLPGSEIWAEQHAEDEAKLAAVWQEIQRRKSAIVDQSRIAA